MHVLVAGTTPFIGSGRRRRTARQTELRQSTANQRKQLFNADMQAALDQGPDWVKKHLTDEATRARQALS